MNWLAHTLLSPDSAEFRIGNIAADWVKGERRLVFSPEIQRGFACHKAIDVFTDAHPVVQRSQRRIVAPYRRYAGVLIDIYYDHFLIMDWPAHCDAPLRAYLDKAYAGFAAHAPQLPEEINRGFAYMRRDDWLGGNNTIEGVGTTLKRVAQRLRPGNLLAEGVCQLEPNYAELQTDFREFFPQLRQHVMDWMARGMA